jgi:hypothetical protein
MDGATQLECTHSLVAPALDLTLGVASVILGIFAVQEKWDSACHEYWNGVACWDYQTEGSRERMLGGVVALVVGGVTIASGLSGYANPRRVAAARRSFRVRIVGRGMSDAPRSGFQERGPT